MLLFELHIEVLRSSNHSSRIARDHQNLNQIEEFRKFVFTKVSPKFHQSLATFSSDHEPSLNFALYTLKFTGRKTNDRLMGESEFCEYHLRGYHSMNIVQWIDRKDSASGNQ